MTDLSNESPPPENDSADLRAHSPLAMLFTMLLLIAGLLLTSTMLIYYALDQKGGDGEQSGLMANLKAKSEQLKAAAEKQKAAFTAAQKAAADKEQQKVTSIEEQQNNASGTEKNQKTAETSGLSKFFNSDKVRSVRWPRLKVTGFGRSVLGDGDFAIINGEKVLEDGYIDKVRVVEIRTQDVVLEYKGEQRTISVEIDP